LVITYTFKADTSTAVIELGGGAVPAGLDGNPTLSGFTLEDLSTLPPVNLTGMWRLPDGSFQFGFNAPSGTSNTVLASTNVAWPLNAWSNLGSALESPSGSGQYLFTDPQATNLLRRFYRVRSP
jgi:hypothetical protein